MSAAKKSGTHATLTLTIEYIDDKLPDILEHARETIEKACEQAKVEGYLDLHSNDRIYVEDLK